MSCPDNWGVTKGDAILVQQEEATRYNNHSFLVQSLANIWEFLNPPLCRKEQIAEVQKIQMEKLKM